MNDNNSPSQAPDMTTLSDQHLSSDQAVLYVHAKGVPAATENQLKALSALGFPLLSRMDSEYVQTTQFGYDHPLKLLAEIAARCPHKSVIFLRAGLLPSRSQIEELLALSVSIDASQAAQVKLAAFTVLSNASTDVNPFAGLVDRTATGKAKLTADDAAKLVSLLAPGQLHEINHWSDHFVLLPAATVNKLLKSPTEGDLLQQLQAIDAQLLLDDQLFLHDPMARLFEKPKLAAHESLPPPPFSLLSARLQQWLDSNQLLLESGPIDQSKPDQGAPTTLHITHSWGGGVAQWLSSFISADAAHAPSHRHFQLRSENASSGRGYAQKLSLYQGNQLDCPIASWWLQPAIQSIDICNADYQQIVAEICRRYGITRVFVSSLVGHSLDALSTGLPTLQVLHDHFPVWPLLSVSPEPYLRAGDGADLSTAIKQHSRQLEFTDKNAAAWVDVRDAYLAIVKKGDVKLAAPGESVLRMQRRLFPAFADLPITVIPHAFPAMTIDKAVLPKPRKDGRLRMVILGRMQTGKGQQLLIEALPELSRHVQVYLLGTGKSGEQFFGMPGVDVVLNYQRDELNALLSTIGPDFAALLSVVPETFSFTLSELQQLQIPVIATSVGSFPDRVKQDVDGWLIEPTAAALVAQVAKLCASPENIQTARKQLADSAANAASSKGAAAKMVAAYNQLCPAAGNASVYLPAQHSPARSDLNQDQAAAAAFAQMLAHNEKLAIQDQNKSLGKEVERRTKWAQDATRQLEEWVPLLEAEIDKLKVLVETTQLELNEKKAHLSELQHTADQNAQILASLSWRITRPMRVARRAMKNFMLARAWNPARWPWLFSQTVKNLSTLGLKGTIQRIQYAGAEAPPQPHSTDQLESVGDPKPPEAFPVHAKPHVSIVIPVYNKWTYTAACLRSLIETPSRYSYEVIVVDDQSSDETAGYLEAIGGLKYLRNDENLGFVGSCNRGASIATGEYIVMLNNDTQVLDGWLDELIDTFEREPQAGMVGARLVYPDGRLQESGGIIFSDGSGWNYGREQDAEQPQYLFLREVDYCSGACIALKTKTFNDLGGFDQRYAPAYYEDTDLAFRIREAGMKVFIQPMSAVIHFEGVTSGTDTSTGVKKYQLINQQKFLERWKDELQSQPAPVSGHDDPAATKTTIRAASEHRINGKILFIDATTPEPDKDSGSVRLTNLMQCCRDLGYGITFFADNRDYDGKYTRDLQRSGIEVLYHPWLDSLSDFFRTRGAEFDYVFVSRHYIAINYISLIKRYCPDAEFIFDTVDLHYLREQRHAELEDSLPLKRTAQQTRRAELNVIKAADATVVVSTVEKAVLKEDAPDAKVHVLSNIHHVPGRDKGFKERRDIYFVGGYQHPPNVDAACWFVNDIWPLIHAELPEVKFHLIGSNAPASIRSLSGDGVTVHGFVESLDAYLNGCKLAVAPLRYGAGVKGKVNMSMAHGQPVVATPVAVEGMFAEHERELLVAEDAPAFAREVIRLYQDEDLWNRCSDASVTNVETHFSLSAARSSLIKLFSI